MKNEIKNFMSNAKDVVVENGPSILTAVGITGMISTTVLAVRATPKAIKLLDEKKMEVYDSMGDKVPMNSTYKDIKLTTKEVVQTAWKPYIPATITCAASTACLVLANTTANKRTAAAMTLCNITQETYRDYKNMVKETVGEDKAKEIEDNFQAKQFERMSENQVFITGDEITYVDTSSGRAFKSTPEKLEAIRNELNAKLNSEMYVALNEYYYAVGLDCTSMGNDKGWNLDTGLIRFDYSCVMYHGKPAVAIDFVVEPREKYDCFR